MFKGKARRNQRSASRQSLQETEEASVSKLRSYISRTSPAMVVAAATLLLVGGVGYAAIPNSETAEISGCYENRTGFLRVIDTEADKACTRWEIAISWNQEGPEGIQGLPGLQGEAGTDGTNGTNGIDGIDGIDGKTILNGSGTPDGGLGTVGDFYLDTTTPTLFGPKTATGWGTAIPLVGPAGANGTNGADGADGLPGEPGADGTDGTDGTTIRNGTNDPDVSLGTFGDFYLNTTSSALFGPKTIIGWGAGTSLVGPAGADGVDGAPGTDGIDGIDG
ncbi:MAG: hypothetical protein ACRDKT_14635, partial [Actinomycetota bacterium]